MRSPVADVLSLLAFCAVVAAVWILFPVQA
jgi:hypothetical protein